ncbi:Hypothetical protein A7982_03331 [Minicystis rosea]|nr:Hypothetical protein A7982_03331 [Minicystis rosea]
MGLDLELRHAAARWRAAHASDGSGSGPSSFSRPKRSADSRCDRGSVASDARRARTTEESSAISRGNDRRAARRAHVFSAAS